MYLKNERGSVLPLLQDEASDKRNRPIKNEIRYLYSPKNDPAAIPRIHPSMSDQKNIGFRHHNQKLSHQIEPHRAKSNAPPFKSKILRDVAEARKELSNQKFKYSTIDPPDDPKATAGDRIIKEKINSQTVKLLGNRIGGNEKEPNLHEDNGPENEASGLPSLKGQSQTVNSPVNLKNVSSQSKVGIGYNSHTVNSNVKYSSNYINNNNNQLEGFHALKRKNSLIGIKPTLHAPRKNLTKLEKVPQIPEGEKKDSYFCNQAASPLHMKNFHENIEEKNIQINEVRKLRPDIQELAPLPEKVELEKKIVHSVKKDAEVGKEEQTEIKEVFAKNKQVIHAEEEVETSINLTGVGHGKSFLASKKKKSFTRPVTENNSPLKKGLPVIHLPKNQVQEIQTKIRSKNSKAMGQQSVGYMPRQNMKYGKIKPLVKSPNIDGNNTSHISKEEEKKITSNTSSTHGKKDITKKVIPPIAEFSYNPDKMHDSLFLAKDRENKQSSENDEKEKKENPGTVLSHLISANPRNFQKTQPIFGKKGKKKKITPPTNNLGGISVIHPTSTMPQPTSAQKQAIKIGQDSFTFFSFAANAKSSKPNNNNNSNIGSSKFEEDDFGIIPPNESKGIGGKNFERRDSLKSSNSNNSRNSSAKSWKVNSTRVNLKPDHLSKNKIEEENPKDEKENFGIKRDLSLVPPNLQKENSVPNRELKPKNVSITKTEEIKDESDSLERQLNVSRIPAKEIVESIPKLHNQLVTKLNFSRDDLEEKKKENIPSLENLRYSRPQKIKYSTQRKTLNHVQSLLTKDFNSSGNNTQHRSKIEGSNNISENSKLSYDSTTKSDHLSHSQSQKNYSNIHGKRSTNLQEIKNTLKISTLNPNKKNEETKKEKPKKMKEIEITNYQHKFNSPAIKAIKVIKTESCSSLSNISFQSSINNSIEEISTITNTCTSQRSIKFLRENNDTCSLGSSILPMHRNSSLTVRNKNHPIFHLNSESEVRMSYNSLHSSCHISQSPQLFITKEKVKKSISISKYGMLSQRSTDRNKLKRSNGSLPGSNSPVFIKFASHQNSSASKNGSIFASSGSVKSTNLLSESKDVTSSIMVTQPPSKKTEFEGMSGKEIEWKAERVIGNGRSAQVILAKNKKTDSLFAVKRYIPLPNLQEHTEAIKNFKEEINILKKLKHKNIVDYHGGEVVGNELFIYMEYHPAGSLATYISKLGILREEKIRKYTKQMLEGLHYLHEMKIIHRDIKCANILLSLDDTIKLSDFGCSIELEGSISSSNSCIITKIKGSIPWLAPEVIKQKGHGRKSDIWSLGCCIIEMATGSPPWPKFDNFMNALLFIANSNQIPPIPSGLSECAVSFLKCCFTRDYKKRPTAAELLNHPFVSDIKS